MGSLRRLENRSVLVLREEALHSFPIYTAMEEVHE